MENVKRALVLEGGAIRSAYLSGVLQAFHDHHFNHFDYVIGSSAGACCGANFIAGEPEKNCTILSNYLTSDRFVSYPKIFSKENIVDIDYLIDDVCKKYVPLDIPKIKSAEATLYISATDYLTGEPVYFNNREHDIFEALRASCAMPYLYRRPVYINGRRYMDGGLFDAIPIKKALELGCQEIIVISTRPQGYQKEKTRLPKWLFNVVAGDNPQMGDFFHRRHQYYNDILHLIFNPPSGVQVGFIAPQGLLPVSRMTKDKDRVKAAICMGYEEGEAWLVRSPLRFVNLSHRLVSSL